MMRRMAGKARLLACRNQRAIPSRGEARKKFRPVFDNAARQEASGAATGVATPDGRKIEQLSGTSAAARSVIHRHTVRFIWHGASRILLCAFFLTVGCRHTRTHTGTGDVLAVDEQASDRDDPARRRAR